MQKNTLVTLASCCALFTASVLASQNEQQLDVTVLDGKSKIVWLDNGESRSWQLDGVDLNNPVALEQALADLPAAKRDKLIAMLSNKDQAQMQIVKMSADPAKQVHKIVIELDEDSATGSSERKIVKLHKIEGGGDFELLQRLLQDAELNAGQLQQLQALLDAKH